MVGGPAMVGRPGGQQKMAPPLIGYIIGYIIGPMIGPKTGSQKVLKPKKQIVEIEATYVISTAAFFFYSFFHIFAKKQVFQKVN